MIQIKIYWDRYMYLSLFLVLMACDPFNTKIENHENQALTYQANNITTPSSIPAKLNVVSWNIKFGGARFDFFFDCHGTKSLMKKNEVEQNLKLLVEKINQVNPDILFLQEVDILSKRSAYIDMIQWILDNSELNYGVYASQWAADYIPSDGIGKVNSGNVILSKYPLSENERIALPLIESQSNIVQYFYLRRNIVKTKATIGSQELFLFNTHLTAYGEDNIKKEQLTILKDRIDELNTQNKAFIAGGDFNTIPPSSIKKTDFADVVCSDTEDDNYEGEEDYLTDFYNDYHSAIPLEYYKKDNSLYFTHSIDKNIFWNRKIDYLFTNQQISNGLTHQNNERGGLEMMSRSDHAMLSSTIEFLQQ